MHTHILMGDLETEMEISFDMVILATFLIVPHAEKSHSSPMG